jgi:DNA-binding MarR family transcriptional regulator
MTRWEIERAVLSSELPWPARYLALVLLTRADAKTAAIPATYSPSLSTLLAETGMSHAALLKYLDLLESEGWLTRRRPSMDDARAKKSRTRYALRLGRQATVARSPHDLELGRHATTGLGRHATTEQTDGPMSEQEREGLAAVAETLELATGKKKISNEDASRAVALATNGKAGLRDPYRYAVKVIRDDRNPWRFLPTPTPPPVREVLP